MGRNDGRMPGWTRGAATLAPLMLALHACTPALARPTVGLAPAPADDVYSCLLRELGHEGYRVTDVDRSAGFILAERQTDAPDFLEIGHYAWDEVSIVVVELEDGVSEVHLTASRSTQDPRKARTGSADGLPSEVVARPLLEACGGRLADAV